MKNLKVIFLSLWTLMGLSYQVNAQQEPMSMGSSTSVNDRKAGFEELKKMMKSFHQQEAALHQQIKEGIDKNKLLIDQLKTMRQEYMKVIDEQRQKLGLPSLTNPIRKDAGG